MTAKTILCFDLDGTLINSNEAHIASFTKAIELNNLPFVPSRTLLALFGKPADVIVRTLFPDIPERKIQKVAKDKSDFMIKDTYKLVKQVPGAVEALEMLKEKYYIALISNSQHDDITALLKGAGIPAKLFDAAACRQEVAHGKPAPDEIFKIEKKLNAKVEYVIGDTIYDLMAGKAAGKKTIAVLSGVHDMALLSTENPNVIIESVAVLPDLLFEKV
ncbi:MAG TPA: HAD family hydrolase [Nanoarchaeota archaeon]|nr:HAD family hydrolase [Nanoarchaeota archaeon]